MRLALFAAALCVSSLAAHADTFTFSTSATGGGFAVSGTIDATNQGTFDSINSITGGNPAQGLTVTGLISRNGFDGNDNQLFTAGSPNGGLLVDQNGFAFTASQINPNNQGNTSYEVRVYSNRGSYFFDLTNSDGYMNGAMPATLSVTNTTPTSVTPEPSSLALLGTGLLGVVGVARKQFF